MTAQPDPSENETRDVCAIHVVALPEGVTA